MNESEKLEFLNKQIIEIKSGPNYSKMAKIVFILESFKKLEFLKIFNAFRIFLLPKTKLKACKSLNFIPVKNKKIVVYTCITGKYDNIIDPLYFPKNVDYILFTDDNTLKSDAWKVKKIPLKILEKNFDNVLINRYIKINSPDIFNSYDYSIYIDGNIRVVGDVTGYINAINEVTGLAFHRHISRECVFQEAKACKYLKKGNKAMINNQIKKYKKNGFPSNFGLLEANVIVTDLKNENAIKILSCWWKEFLQSKSFRDQLSLPYVIWANGYSIEDIGFLGVSTASNCKLQIVLHRK